MGVRCGVDPAVLSDVVNASTGRCWPSEVNNPVPGVVSGAPAERGYEGGFGTAPDEQGPGVGEADGEEVGARMELVGEWSVFMLLSKRPRLVRERTFP